MNRNHCFTLAIGLFAGAALASWGALQPYSPDSEPGIEEPTCPLRITPPVGFSEVFEETTAIPYAFVLHNDGDTPIVVDSIKASCSCTVASIEPREVPAKGNVEFKVVYNATKSFGELPERDIHVFADDAPCRRLTCKVTGVRHRRFTVTPQTVDFGTIIRGNSPTAKVQIEAHGESMRLVPESTMSSIPALSVKPISHTSDGEGESLVLELSIPQEAPIGAIDGYVFVPRAEDDGVGPMFYVYGNIKGEIEAVPQKVLFGVSRDAVPRTRFVRLISSTLETQQEVSEIRGITVPNGIEVVFEGYEGGFGLTLDPTEFASGVQKGEVVVAGDLVGETHTVAIPFLVNIRRADE